MDGVIETKRVALDRGAVARDGGIAGYASVFGGVDQSGDVVAAGAFGKSLARRGAGQVRMLWQHDPYEPIGVWEMIAEDAHGLRVRGRVLGDVARGREVLALLRSGAVDGLSIGFKTVRSHTDDLTGVRTLLEIELWEISVVTFPMNEAARVETVKQFGPRGDKNFLNEEQELRELAHAIRQAGEAMQPSPCAKALGDKRGRK